MDLQRLHKFQIPHRAKNTEYGSWLMNLLRLHKFQIPYMNNDEIYKLKRSGAAEYREKPAAPPSLTSGFKFNSRPRNYS